MPLTQKPVGMPDRQCMPISFQPIYSHFKIASQNKTNLCSLTFGAFSNLILTNSFYLPFNQSQIVYYPHTTCVPDKNARQGVISVRLTECKPK